MYDTIKKLNELGTKWLYVKNWLNQVVLLFRYAVMVHQLCKRPWMALDLTGNSNLSRRVLGSNVSLIPPESVDWSWILTNNAFSPIG